jgi:outer membrane protein, adhesin transport system
MWSRPRVATWGFMALVCTQVASPAYAVALHDLLQASAQSHPSVRAANFEAGASLDGVEAAKRQYWPTLTVQAESGKSSAASRSLRVEQTLWNGGLTKNEISSAETKLSISRFKLELQKQKQALQVGAAWQALWSAQGRLKVAQTSQVQLKRFETMMRRRVEGELSVPVELELVRARLLQAKVDASRAQADSQAAIERLEQLSGFKGLQKDIGVLPVGLPVTTFTPSIDMLQGTLAQVESVVDRQPEVRLAREEILLARQQVSVRRSQLSPQAFARLDQPLVGGQKAKAYVGMAYSTGAGFSSFLEVDALAKRAQAAEQGAEAAALDIRMSLMVDMTEVVNARERLASLSDAVRGADTVLESYERQFVANRKSWQDLMNAVRELSQNEAARVEAETQLVGALLRLQLRIDPAAIDARIAAGSPRPQNADLPTVGPKPRGN